VLKIQKLYTMEFVKTLTVLTLGLSTVFSILVLIDKIDDFLPYSPGARPLIMYMLLGMPRFVQYLMPMAILLSSLFIFSQALKRHEITAIKAASGKMKKVLKPFVGMGLVLTLFAFVLGEIAVPAAVRKLHALKDSIMQKGKRVIFKEGRLYMRGKDGAIVRVELYMPDRNLSQEVSIFQYDAGGLKERIDAETAEWKADKWELKNVVIHDIAGSKVIEKKSLVYEGIESPGIFQEDLWKVDEMTISELLRYDRRLNKAGFRNTKLPADINSRLSYPLINFFMLLLGISLSLGGEQKLFEWISHAKILSGKHANVGVISTGLGLIISLAYWFGYSLCLSLGYAGTIPPGLAPWIVPVVFAGASIYLYSRIPE